MLNLMWNHYYAKYVIAELHMVLRFSIVHECVHKQSGEHFAVKVIEKGTLDQEEKQLLRTEIAGKRAK